MSRIKSFLRRSIISDPHLWIAFAAAVIVLFLHFLHAIKLIHQEIPPEGLLVVITISILALTADRLRESEQLGQKIDHNTEKIDQNTEKIDKIVSAVLNTRVALLDRPSTPEDYEHLWGGFSGKYHVYNPSYRVDRYIEDDIVKILVHRYQHPRFDSAEYLFLTGDPSGQRDLKTFCQLMNRVRKVCPEVVNKIQVRERKDKAAASTAEMYLGMRYGKPTAVVELREPALSHQHGMPDYYLVIDKEDVVQHYLKNHFVPEWSDDSATPVNIFGLPDAPDSGSIV